MVWNREKSETRLSTQSAVLDSDGRCGRGDEKRTGRRSLGRREKILNIGLRRRFGYSGNYKERMKEMIKRMERYLKRKKLQLNTEKEK